MTLAPRIEGAVQLRSSAAQFSAAFAQRVADGLLLGRSSYRVIDERADLLRVRATDLATALNVGLNDVEFRFSSTGSLEYRVRYWRWAGYVLSLCGLLGATGLVLMLTLDVRSYIAANSYARLPGLSVDQNLALAWGSVVFWGFVWPWVLIGLHKRPLRRLLEGIIRDTDTQGIQRR